jgi:hypothetical protein
MRFPILFLALALGATSAASQEPAAPDLDLEQKMLLRCSAVFALVAFDQRRGAPIETDYPPIEDRGREFFVQAGAVLMDELELDRESLTILMRGEVDDLSRAAMSAEDPAAYVDGVMQPCLIALEASGL